MSKVTKPSDAPDKPVLTAEERLQRARARHAEEGAKLEKRSVALTDKQVAREKLMCDLAQERTYERTASQDWAQKQREADDALATLRTHERNVRRLEFRLGLRKRGQPAVEQPPAEAPAGPQDEASAQEGGVPE